jgi:oxaloacetate decarboxylase
VPISEEIRKTIIGNEEVFTGRPADKIAPEYDKLVEETRDFARSEEDVLSYALFPQVAKDFLIKKYENE